MTSSVPPTRPAGLELAPPDGPRSAFPKHSELEAEFGRGRALHFFANHELLALELMALALLRFPDAPPAFRKRIVATMRDEQRHMNLYLDRMTELGVELGTIPLNSFFWDQIASMQKPMDFIVGMSLTFEQANLDFSLHYRDAFRAMGDVKTADIMQQVLTDEVAHVRHGLHFFEQWRDPGLSQWEAYQTALDFPLTPARAKGIGFTQKHRLDAGFTPDFIDRLRVYSSSKGRQPRVFVFNPDTETALGRRAKGHTPTRAVVALARDLELIPMFLMGKEDVLLVRSPPRTEHLSQLLELGYSIPEFVVADLDRRQLSDGEPLGERRLSGLAPWGWDPAVAEFLQPLAPTVVNGTNDLQSIVDARAHLASKAWLAPRLPELLSAVPEDWRGLCIQKSLPTVATDWQAVTEQLAVHLNAGHTQVVVKAPFGSAGRGALRVEASGPLENQQRWIEDTLAVQGSVVLEPWYDRQLDLSYLFKVRADGGMTPVGLTRFFTDATGRYRGSLLAQIRMGLSEPIHRFVFQGSTDARWVLESSERVAEALASQMATSGFTGRAGIDLMVVRDAGGDFKLRIPLELNPRATMGHVAHAIGKPLGSRAVGVWLCLHPRDLEATGATDFAELLGRLQSHLPRQLEGSPPTLRQGAFPTNDASTAQQALSVAVLAPTFEEVIGALNAVGLPDPRGVERESTSN